MMFYGLILASVLILAVEVPEGPVEITLLDGRTVQCAVIVKTPVYLYVERADGEKERLPVSEIVAAKSIGGPAPAEAGETAPAAAPTPAADLARYERQLREINPTTAAAWRQFGRWCLENTFIPQGKAAYEKSLTLDPADPRPRREELADLLAKAGRRYDAQEVLATLIRAHPDDQALRDKFIALLDALDKDLDDLVARVKAFYRAQAYDKVLDALVPQVQGGHRVFLETLSVKIERELGLPLDEVMVDCRLKKVQTTGPVHKGVTEYERPFLARHLQTKADQAYHQIPAHVIQRLTDPRFRRPPLNRYPYVLPSAQRDQYLESAKEARLYYDAIVDLMGTTDPAVAAHARTRIQEMDKAIAALKNATVR